MWKCIRCETSGILEAEACPGCSNTYSNNLILIKKNRKSRSKRRSSAKAGILDATSESRNNYWNWVVVFLILGTILMLMVIATSSGGTNSITPGGSALALPPPSKPTAAPIQVAVTKGTMWVVVENLHIRFQPHDGGQTRTEYLRLNDQVQVLECRLDRSGVLWVSYNYAKGVYWSAAKSARGVIYMTPIEICN